MRTIGLFLLGHSIAVAAPEAPTMLVASSPSATVVNLSWVDNSSDEISFELEIKTGAGPFESVGTLRSNVTSGRLGGRIPGTPYVFRMFAINDDGRSPSSNELTFIARDLAYAGPTSFAGIAGEAFAENVAFRDATTNEIFATSSSTLPPGLSIDPETGVLSGILAGGQYTGFTLSTIDPVYPREVSVAFAIDAAPRVVRPAINVLDTGVTDIDLNVHFDDPDIGSAVRFATSEGDIHVGLFDDSAPLTVKNFFAYSDSGAWDGTFFHRAAPNQNGGRFVNQGGGYRPLGDGTFESIPDRPGVQNEFSTDRPNTKGTISMAKKPNRPDSATNEWFFSLEDNRRILDPQNGGFTVFGKVLSGGLSILNAINDLPTGDYNPIFDGSPRLFGDWPLREGFTDPTVDGAIVSVNSVARIPALTYTSTSPGIVLTNNIARLSSSIGTEISITATDLDGLSTTAIFPVTGVDEPIDFATYAASLPIPNEPTANPDGDALTSFLEFATGTNPLLPEQGTLVFGNSGTAPTLTFPFEAGIASLTAIVETSTDISAWTPAWNSDQGIAVGANLLSTTPGAGSTTVLTVSSGVPFAAEPRQFLRLRIIEN